MQNPLSELIFPLLIVIRIFAELVIRTLLDFDHRLFLTIHHFRNAFLDEIMPWISGRFFWIPLYALLLFLIIRRFKKQSIIIIGIIIVLVILCDQSSNLLKNNVCRLRPCYDAALSGQVITPLGGGGQYGFVSAHAANTFGLATFLFLLAGSSKGAKPGKRKWWALLFLWSLLVSWSRIYLGVHFPFDVLGGAAIGAFWAGLLFFLYERVIPVIGTRDEGRGTG